MYELTSNIESMIYEVRGKQVMFTKDVAFLYNVETKRINELIKRNVSRFPSEFCFQLTEEEIKLFYSRSQNATLNKNGNNRGNNIKYLPFVLTEQGIMMLSGLLRSDIAVKVNVYIINAFVAMRKYISSNLIEQRYINSQVMKNTEDIKLLQESFSKLEEKEKNNHIFFEGQIYNAYSLLVDILSQAQENILIIDNYIDKKLLDILAEINVEVEIITKNINETAIEKYQSQYQNVSIKLSKSFHDRFIILDKEILYHCGASFKDLGKKCFAINKIEDNEIVNRILEIIE